MGSNLPTYSVGWADTRELTSLAPAPEAIRINEQGAARATEASCIVPRFIAVIGRCPLPRVGPNFRR